MDILKLRKNLPVHQQMTEFIDMFQSSQFTVMVGETGSGKTTQSVGASSMFTDLPLTLCKLKGFPNTSPTPICRISVDRGFKLRARSPVESPR